MFDLIFYRRLCHFVEKLKLELHINYTNSQQQKYLKKYKLQNEQQKIEEIPEKEDEFTTYLWNFMQYFDLKKYFEKTKERMIRTNSYKVYSSSNI